MLLLNGDCIEQMQKLIDEGVQVESVVTDPPYELGFMGKSWDASGIAFDKKTWELAFELLNPGGYLLAFSASRNYHRIAVAVEDAGFEIRDQIMWIYGSGFPKSLNLGDGWGTALKPAHEPIVMAKKFIEGTNKNNREKYGTGGLNIDGCRINYVSDTHEPTGRFPANVIMDAEAGAILDEQAPKTGNGHMAKIKVTGYGNFGGGGASYEGKGEKLDGLSGASKFFYCPKTSMSEKHNGDKNTHPTVKPVELMKYLCKLVTPKGGTVLDPFMGSGSTGMAAKDEGFEFIGIEKEKEYIEIAESRITRFAPLMDFM